MKLTAPTVRLRSSSAAAIFAMAAAAIATGPLAAGTAATAAPTRVTWGTSMPAALAKAKATRRLVLVDFTADWCTYCKKMDAETFPDPKVAARVNGSFLPVKLDTDREGRALAQKLGIRSLPTYVFMDGSGAELTRISGFVPAPDFAEALGQIDKVHRTLPSLEARYKSSPRDLAAAGELATTYAHLGRIAKADAALKRVASLDPRNRSGRLSSGSLALGEMHQGSGDFTGAAALYRQALRVAKRPEETAYAHLSLAICSLQQNAPKPAMAELRAVLQTPGAPQPVRDTAQKLLARVQEATAR